MYQAAKICVMCGQGIHNRCEASTRQLKEVQGMDKESTRGTRHLPGI